jgi:hypothetical protein
LTTKRNQWLLLAGILLAGGLIAACNNFFFLRGTLHGDCDPPRGSSTNSTQSQTSNCQVGGSICCRIGVHTPRTSCEYPEDCYVAPIHGICATPVDCVNTQTCMGGTCQCTLGGPECLNPTTGITTCCTADQLCDPVQFVCAVPDGGVVTVVDMAIGVAGGPDLHAAPPVSTDMAQ